MAWCWKRNNRIHQILWVEMRFIAQNQTKPNQNNFNEKRFNCCCCACRVCIKPDAAHTPFAKQNYNMHKYGLFIFKPIEFKNRRILLCYSCIACVSVLCVAFYSIWSIAIVLRRSCNFKPCIFIVFPICESVMRTSYWRTWMQCTLLKKKYAILYASCCSIWVCVCVMLT